MNEKINSHLIEANIKLQDENKLLKEDKEILKRRIERAIEFLKENAYIDEDVGYFCDDLRYDDCSKLLKILKGEDNE